MTGAIVAPDSHSSRWRWFQLRVAWLLTVALAARQRADRAPRLALRLDHPQGKLGLHGRDRCFIHAFEPPISLSHSGCLRQRQRDRDKETETETKRQRER